MTFIHKQIRRLSIQAKLVLHWTLWIHIATLATVTATDPDTERAVSLTRSLLQRGQTLFRRQSPDVGDVCFYTYAHRAVWTDCLIYTIYRQAYNNNRGEINKRASPTRIFFSPSQWNPTVRSLQVPSPSSSVLANAWLVSPATCTRCHIYYKDSRSLYSVSIRSYYTRALFLQMKNRTSTYSNFWF